MSSGGVSQIQKDGTNIDIIGGTKSLGIIQTTEHIALNMGNKQSNKEFFQELENMQTNKKNATIAHVYKDFTAENETVDLGFCNTNHQTRVEDVNGNTAMADIIIYQPTPNSFDKFKEITNSLDKNNLDTYLKLSGQNLSEEQILTHESTHFSHNQSGYLKTTGMSQEEIGKTDNNSEISAHISQLLALREEYKTNKNPDIFQNTDYAFYGEAIKSGTITAFSADKKDQNAEYSLIMNGTQNMWVSKYQKEYSEQTDDNITKAVEKQGLLNSTGNAARYNNSKHGIFTKTIDGQTVDLAQYQKQDISLYKDISFEHLQDDIKLGKTAEKLSGTSNGIEKLNNKMKKWVKTAAKLSGRLTAKADKKVTKSTLQTENIKNFTQSLDR